MGEGTFGKVLECWDRKHKASWVEKRPMLPADASGVGAERAPPLGHHHPHVSSMGRVGTLARGCGRHDDMRPSLYPAAGQRSISRPPSALHTTTQPLEQEYVAIKIVRNIDKYRHAAMMEVSVTIMRVAMMVNPWSPHFEPHTTLLQLEVLNTLEMNDPVGSK